jgi:crotonobetainyl-CoA:carnitine CoA-transferase CaiB-like acyl-CoA transferase
VDFTHALNGPFCTMLLGHLGAEVIKVEPPKGDNFRRSWMRPDDPRDGYEFLWVNTNKKSIMIDLRTERGIEVAKRIVAVSDVLVENYQKGTMEKFGLDYESVRKINPRLIYAFSRGYGESGLYSPYGSNAGVNNGMAGWTHSAWELNDAWGTKALGIGDEAGGVSMTVGILAALYAREQTGQGQKIEVSMQEAVLGFMVSTFHEHFTGNKVGGPPTQVGDGYFTLRAPPMSDETWEKLAAVMGREEDLRDDQRFATAEGRRKNAGELDRVLKEWARDKTRQEVWVALRDLGYFGAPVLSVEEVMEDPHVKDRSAFIEREHPTNGKVTLLAPWIRMSGTPTAIRDVSPTRGQHTDWVLREVLEMDAQEVARLRSADVVS